MAKNKIVKKVPKIMDERELISNELSKLIIGIRRKHKIDEDYTAHLICFITGCVINGDDEKNFNQLVKEIKVASKK